VTRRSFTLRQKIRDCCEQIQQLLKEAKGLEEEEWLSRLAEVCEEFAEELF